MYHYSTVFGFDFPNGGFLAIDRQLEETEEEQRRPVLEREKVRGFGLGSE